MRVLSFVFIGVAAFILSLIYFMDRVSSLVTGIMDGMDFNIHGDE